MSRMLLATVLVGGEAAIGSIDGDSRRKSCTVETCIPADSLTIMSMTGEDR